MYFNITVITHAPPPPTTTTNSIIIIIIIIITAAVTTTIVTADYVNIDNVEYTVNITFDSIDNNNKV